MKSYTINFADSGEVCEGYFDSDLAAIKWAKSIFANRGYVGVIRGGWDADGQNDDGEQCYSMAFWDNEDDAENDPGVNSFAQLCKVGS